MNETDRKKSSALLFHIRTVYCDVWISYYDEWKYAWIWLLAAPALKLIAMFGDGDIAIVCTLKQMASQIREYDRARYWEINWSIGRITNQELNISNPIRWNKCFGFFIWSIHYFTVSLSVSNHEACVLCGDIRLFSVVAAAAALWIGTYLSNDRKRGADLRAWYIQR